MICWNRHTTWWRHGKWGHGCWRGQATTCRSVTIHGMLMQKCWGYTRAPFTWWTQQITSINLQNIIFNATNFCTNSLNYIYCIYNLYYVTVIPLMLKFFQFGLGCLSRNLNAVTSCRVIKLSEAAVMTTTSCDPVSQCGSIISCLFWILTTQSDGDLPPDVTILKIYKEI